MHAGGARAQRAPRVIPAPDPPPHTAPVPSGEGCFARPYRSAVGMQLPEQPVDPGPGPGTHRVACKPRRVMTHNGRGLERVRRCWWAPRGRHTLQLRWPDGVLHPSTSATPGASRSRPAPSAVATERAPGRTRRRRELPTSGGPEHACGKAHRGADPASSVAGRGGCRPGRVAAGGPRWRDENSSQPHRPAPSLAQPVGAQLRMNVPQSAVHLRERNPRGLLPMEIVG